jgi:hypothetical protein
LQVVRTVEFSLVLLLLMIVGALVRQQSC